MICSNCGTQNDAGRKFCVECATRLAVACPSCGTANPPTAKFCGECATPLLATVPGQSPAAAATATRQLAGQQRATPTSAVPFAERRLVSILFADLDPTEPAVSEAAEAARKTFQQLQAAPFLERLGVAMVRTVVPDEGVLRGRQAPAKPASARS